MTQEELLKNLNEIDDKIKDCCEILECTSYKYDICDLNPAEALECILCKDRDL